MVFHFNVITGYEAFPAIQLSSVPIQIILHIQNLRKLISDDEVVVCTTHL